MSPRLGAWLAALAMAGCGRASSSSATGLISHDKFFVVTGSHKSFSCDQCHDPAAPGFALADNGVYCTGCHTGPATSPLHASVPGYSWATASCLGCHRNGGALPANHDTAFFPVTGTKHATFGCSECHGATKAIGDITCTPCHAQPATDSAHAAIPAQWIGRLDGVTYLNYQWASAYCLKCHADGQVDPIASHPSFDHGLNGEGHAPFCLTCHAVLGPAGGKAWGADFSRSSCLACHSSNPGG